MGGPSDPQPGGDVVVTVTATSVRDAAGNAVPQPAPQRAPSTALRKERAGLARRYQELRGDLGGLLIEMARRDHFNLHLLRLRAAEAVAVEQRAREIDGALVAPAARSGLPAGTVAMTAKRCASCSGSIPADANFCAYCGTPVA